ncbi:1,4-alpha-glucan branching protein GlgB [Tumebacillus permanentifrigoris]|uniref:1,4-alpha-glucan branching enzyme GlgB n=1 Tax=Tumebacillus permanentifrigoris TaxID=378543 RepID=A0A316D672_9BACL|nr:1,4-alpha-glucan branching protein GlgB [Tumebacillus permanentifrigoris]PWK09034.1 1,4-alpha-glucan branching enzyme [Tumebacillus permanentifrigoris]
MSVATPNDYDLYLYHQGNLTQSYRTMGAHPVQVEGVSGVRFTVWAPNARAVRVVGDFNDWCGDLHELTQVTEPGVWSGFVPDLPNGSLYKYELLTQTGETLLKSDPYAFYAEVRPHTASRVYDLSGYEWQDSEWQRQQEKLLKKPVYNRPVNIYEVHLGSWKKKPTGDFYTYRELADELLDYVSDLGYTHLELMPVAEHPYDRSWGYQTTGYYAATSRFGTPHDLMYFVDQAHQRGLAVILDWVPGHFAKDAHGLRLFDGTPCYEYADWRKAEKPQWGTLSFDFGRPEVLSFLISNALFWMDMFHIDGLRIDAVASMLYLNFCKPENQWSTNELGGTENLEAVAFLRKLNEVMFERYPHALMMAEDSSEWSLVSRPTFLGGLGFNFKWNMGWMNDTLSYLEQEPIYRQHNHDKVTFAILYAYTENFLLPLSHDEVVHGKKSLLNKMPGDYWQKFANLRVLYSYLYTHPGKKLLFMGGEFGQFDEWKDESELDWGLLDYEMHGKMREFVKDLNHLYRQEPALWELDHEPEGYRWIDADNNQQSIAIYQRLGKKPSEAVIVLCNFNTMAHQNFRFGVPKPGKYVEIFNSDDPRYGGSGVLNAGELPAKKQPMHNQPYSLQISVPPLGMVVLKKKKAERKGKS